MTIQPLDIDNTMALWPAAGVLATLEKLNEIIAKVNELDSQVSLGPTPYKDMQGYSNVTVALA